MPTLTCYQYRAALYCSSCATSLPDDPAPGSAPRIYTLAPGRAVRCSRCRTLIHGPSERPPAPSYERATWTVEAGRSVLRDGVEVFTLHKAEGTRPVEADELTRRIAELLTLHGA